MVTTTTQANTQIFSSPIIQKSIQHLVFIDSNVPDYDYLSRGVIPGAEVIILEPDRDGIKQITKVLSSYSFSNSVSLHLVSHGSPGCLYLGNSKLSLETLSQYELDLQTWSNQLSIINCQLSILLYGCNVAAGDAGAEFIAKLHKITGAEIAASTTRVGNVDLGGNWELDVSVGLDKLQLAFTEEAQQNYAGVFIDIFVDNFDGSNPGWVVNPNGTDTATGDSSGQWGIGDPVPHDRGTIAPAQIEANSSSNALITGLTATNTNTDVDGITTVHSPNFSLPSTGFSSIDLSLNYYHAVTGGSTDPLTIELVRASGNTVLSTLLNSDPSTEQDAAWTPLSASLDSFAGEHWQYKAFES